MPERQAKRVPAKEQECLFRYNTKVGNEPQTDCSTSKKPFSLLEIGSQEVKILQGYKDGSMQDQCHIRP